MKLTLVIVSDTHGQHRQLNLPKGDVLIHCGDILSGPLLNQSHILVDFNNWLGTQKFKHKLVIAGNHDHLLGRVEYADVYRGVLSNCTYLQDESVVINGVKFYGSPWTPDFFPEHWVFNQPRGSEVTQARWAQIPDDTNVLITHGPPQGVMDVCRDIHDSSRMVRVGCSALRHRISHLNQLKLHAFGHIHEGRGTHEEGGVKYVNAASLDGRYRQNNPNYTVVVLD